MDFIYYHLQQPIRVVDLAEHVKMNPSYLSTLFKKEVGFSISDYVAKRRVEAAEKYRSICI